MRTFAAAAAVVDFVVVVRTRVRKSVFDQQHILIAHFYYRYCVVVIVVSARRAQMGKYLLGAWSLESIRERRRRAREDKHLPTTALRSVDDDVAMPDVARVRAHTFQFFKYHKTKPLFCTPHHRRKCERSI